MLYVITNPRIYSTLLSELATASISNPVKDSEARKLPYLQAVIREGLRICPPATGLAYRETPDGGDTLCGYYLPARTKVGYNLSGMVGDTKLWGEDAVVYRPERWLNGTPDEIRKMEANADLIFGYGKWSCLGKNIAHTTLNKAIVQVRKFFLGKLG
jgi:cytochrome P450